MNPDNRCIKKKGAISWDVFEKKYSRFFKVKTGNVTKLLRAVIGALYSGSFPQTHQRSDDCGGEYIDIVKPQQKV